MSTDFDPNVHMIPISQILVLNPRARGKKKFAQIIANIGKIGLKRPVTVALIEGHNDHATYYLVCGQGRLEAYIALGEEMIPAIITTGSKAHLLLMSVVENLARRQHSTIELVREISGMKERGYNYAEIAAKTDLAVTYVRAIVQLLAKGEERLLQAVAKGQIPVSVAITIATSDDKAIQQALTEAYESHNLRGRSLLKARSLIETRRSHGKSIRSGPRLQNGKAISSDILLKTYQQETRRQRIVIQKSRICETRLLFAISALKQLFLDEIFVNILHAEQLNTLPQYLAVQINDNGT